MNLTNLTLYLKSKFKSIFIFVIFVAIFLLVFYLYNVPLEAVFYAALLCFCIGAVACFSGFHRFCKTHNALLEAEKTVTSTLSNLPRPRGTTEEDWRRLVALLYNSRQEVLTESEAAKVQMSDYYAMWVHQIKVPIQAMRLLMSEEDKNSPISLELFRIEQYVEMALSYVRLESDYTDYVIKSYALDTIVRNAVRKYAPMFISKKISLECEETGMMVLSDEKWLQFVIEQILSNSLKYTKGGSSDKSCYTELDSFNGTGSDNSSLASDNLGPDYNCDEAKASAVTSRTPAIHIYSPAPGVLSIEDTGIGIAPEDIKRVTQKGFTGYNGRLDKKSTGLGLYLSTEILNRLSHGMRIESEVGVGTKVSIVFEEAEILAE